MYGLRSCAFFVRLRLRGFTPPPPGAVPEMQMYPQMFWRDVNFDLMTHTFLGTKKLEFHHMSILRCGGDLGRVTQDRAYHVRGFPKILSLL